MTHLYAIIDTARDPKLYHWVKACPVHACLFAGALPYPLDRAAPYLVAIETPELAEKWERESQGKAWGMTCRSALGFERMRLHLKKFLQAKLPDGRVVLFRFYDPRVWSSYWPTVNEEERAMWMAGETEFAT